MLVTLVPLYWFPIFWYVEVLVPKLIINYFVISNYILLWPMSYSEKCFLFKAILGSNLSAWYSNFIALLSENVGVTGIVGICWDLFCDLVHGLFVLGCMSAFSNVVHRNNYLIDREFYETIKSHLWYFSNLPHPYISLPDLLIFKRDMVKSSTVITDTLISHSDICLYLFSGFVIIASQVQNLLPFLLTCSFYYIVMSLSLITVFKKFKAYFDCY